MALIKCLRKNVDFRFVEKITYPEVPPRLEYKATNLGEKFIRTLDQFETLQDELDDGESNINNE